VVPTHQTGKSWVDLCKKTHLLDLHFNLMKKGGKKLQDFSGSESFVAKKFLYVFVRNNSDLFFV